jgi:hypothetical protein
MAQAMMQQGMESGSPVIHTGGSNPFARDVPNWGDAITRAAKIYQGNKNLEDTASKQADVARQSQAAMASDLGAFTDKMMPGPQEGVGPPSPDGMPAPGIPGVPDVQGAIKGASASQFPQVQAMAEALLKKQAEGIPTGLDYLKEGPHYDPDAMARYKASGGQDPSLLQGRGQVKVQDDVAVSSTDGKVTGVVPTQTFGEASKDIGGSGIPGQASNVTGKVHALQGGNTTPASTRENELSKAEVKQLETGREEYKQGINSLGNIANVQNRLARLPDSKFGTLAEARNWVNKTAELFGGKPLPETSDMEGLHTGVGNQLIEKVRALAPVTEEDVKVMKGIVGSEGNTKRALSQIMDVAAQAAMRKMGQHEQFVEGFSKQPGIDPGFKQRWIPDYSVGGDRSIPGTTKTMNWNELK